MFACNSFEANLFVARSKLRALGTLSVMVGLLSRLLFSSSDRLVGLTSKIRVENQTTTYMGRTTIKIGLGLLCSLARNMGDKESSSPLPCSPPRNFGSLRQVIAGAVEL